MLTCGVFATAMAVATPKPVTPKDPSTATSAKITAILHQRLPDLRVDQVRPAAFGGMYEVVSGDDLVYSDASGEHLLIGRLMDTATRENLTEKRWTELHPVDFATLPLQLAIKTVKGDGSRKLAVFSDPLCPYCQQLEQQLQGLDNVTIYTFLYPLESVHPGASAKAVRLWCSADRSAAWNQWMIRRTEPAQLPPGCDDNPVATLQALGQKLQINSTPTLFYGDGRRARGVVQQAQLEEGLRPPQGLSAAR